MLWKERVATVLGGEHRGDVLVRSAVREIVFVPMVRVGIASALAWSHLSR